MHPHVSSPKTSASDVVLVAVVAARSRFQRDHLDTKVEDMVIYATTQTHSLAKKAAVVLSLQVRSIEVKSEDRYALRGDSLRAALEEDAKLGRKPFILSKSWFMSRGASVAKLRRSRNGGNDLLRGS